MKPIAGFSALLLLAAFTATPASAACVKQIAAPIADDVKALGAKLTGALSAFGQALSTPAFPGHWQQLQCVKRLGACTEERDAGLPVESELPEYNRLCRDETLYAGPDVALAEVTRVCPMPRDWKERNAVVMLKLREEAGGNDAEALARAFTDPRILDDGTPGGRMDAVLEATEHGHIAGSHTGLDFSDVGFKGDQNKNGEGFRDPHPSSRNQVGHFLTAVGLGYEPRQIEKRTMGLSVRGLLGVPDDMPTEEATVRLIVGHEKAPDPADSSLPSLEQYQGFRRQFYRATTEDVETLRQAERALGAGFVMDLQAAEPILRRVDINFDWDGNSIQDLRLSLAGWHLGHLARSGKFSSREEMAEWIRKNLMP